MMFGLAPPKKATGDFGTYATLTMTRLTIAKSATTNQQQTRPALTTPGVNNKTTNT
jgi:hypothetical protein